MTCRAQLVNLHHYGFINVYAPSGSEKAHERGVFFARDLFHAMSLHSSLKWCLAGDFNCLLSVLDVENGIGYGQKKCSQLSDLLRIKKLDDIFRVLYPYRQEFTFFRPNAAPSRLDRVYVCEELVSSTHSVQHIASLSDHCGVLVKY